MGLTFDVPVDPNANQARQWIIDELAKPPYRAAQPTLFDRISKAIVDWLSSLRIDSGAGVQGPILIAAALVLIGAIVAAYFIFGPPRLNRRSVVTGALFGENDERDAVAMRRSAEVAATAGDWVVAIEEMFRSIARGLAERTIVTVDPGTTARGFAVRAGAVLPAFGERLGEAASDFDDVRYLDRDGTEAAYRQTAALEKDIRVARPELVGAGIDRVSTPMPGSRDPR